MATDVARLRPAGVAVHEIVDDAGHEWTAAFAAATAAFLADIERPAVRTADAPPSPSIR
jgi:hypothetical protein